MTLCDKATPEYWPIATKRKWDVTRGIRIACGECAPNSQTSVVARAGATTDVPSVDYGQVTSMSKGLLAGAVGLDISTDITVPVIL